MASLVLFVKVGAWALCSIIRFLFGLAFFVVAVFSVAAAGAWFTYPCRGHVIHAVSCGLVSLLSAAAATALCWLLWCSQLGSPWRKGREGTHGDSVA